MNYKKKYLKYKLKYLNLKRLIKGGSILETAKSFPGIVLDEVGKAASNAANFPGAFTGLKGTSIKLQKRPKEKRKSSAKKYVSFLIYNRRC